MYIAMSSFYINTFFMAEGSTKSRILFKKILFKSCPVMSNSLPSHGLQHQASLSFTISQSLFKVMSIESGDAIQYSQPLSPAFPLALNLSQCQGLFQ